MFARSTERIAGISWVYAREIVTGRTRLEVTGDTLKVPDSDSDSRHGVAWSR